MAFRTEDNGTFRGAVTFLNALLNAGCISNVHVATNAAIAASKLQHQHRQTYAQASATTAAAESRVVHVVKGAIGELRTFSAGCVVANIGNSTVTVDLLKNGASVLTAAILIDSGDAAYAVVAGTINTAAVVAGDVLEVAVTVAAGTGTLGKGAWASLDLHEDES